MIHINGLRNTDIFNIFVWCWIGCSIVIFLSLLKITAPYGRHARKGWGPLLSNKIGWILMEIPSLLIPVLYFFKYRAYLSRNPQLIFATLWIMHYFYRSLLFPFKLHSKKNIPLSIVAMGSFFNTVNSLINMISITHIKKYSPIWMRDPRFITGVILFITGFLLHYTSDSKLISLRRNGENGYKIPEGGIFNFVSSPNYLGEILEWTGWAIATWSLAGLSFALWTFANLAPRALANHKWYKENFPTYPENRKALIPYIL